MIAFLIIEAGVRLALEEALPCRYVVLTAPSEGMGVDRLATGWNKLRTRLSYGGHFERYVTTVEVVHDRPHLNAILVGGRALPKGRLSDLAEKAGFGSDSYIKSVGATNHDARRLAAYIVKRPTEAVAWATARGATRFRPVRLSSGWKPCGLAEGRAQLRKAGGLPTDPGPFVAVGVARGRVYVVADSVAQPDHDRQDGPR